MYSVFIPVDLTTKLIVTPLYSEKKIDWKNIDLFDIYIIWSTKIK